MEQFYVADDRKYIAGQNGSGAGTCDIAGTIYDKLPDADVGSGYGGHSCDRNVLHFPETVY